MSFRIDDILKPELKGERKENEKKQTEESRNFRSHSFGGKLSHENELQCVSEEQFPGTPQMLCEKTHFLSEKSHFLREKPNFSFAKISHYSEVPQRSSECNYFSEDSFCLGYNEKPQLLNESILQRTLLNRSQFPRSLSDPLGISKYNFLNCERFCDAYAAHNFYGDVPGENLEIFVYLFQGKLVFRVKSLEFELNCVGVKNIEIHERRISENPWN